MPTAAEAQLGDHDGHTVMSSQVRAWRQQPGRHAGPLVAAPSQIAQPSAVDDGDHDGHTVRADLVARLRARYGTAAPTADQTAGGAAAPAAGTIGTPPAAPAQAPSAGIVVETSSGDVRPLTGVIIYGRAPSADHPGVMAGLSPQLAHVRPETVLLHGSTDISRNHVRISLEGGVIVVTDLHSRNGTDVTLPERPKQRLRGGEPTAVLPGTVVDLGDGITLTIRK